MIFRFGGYELDSARRELRCDGARVETEPKAFELLLFLAEHSDRAVSKDELLKTLWPRSIVTETALTRCVMKARRAVNDDPSDPQVIRTVYGHGYRFVADVDMPSDDETKTEIAEVSSVNRSQIWRLAVVTGLLIVAVGGALWALYREGPIQNREHMALAVLPVTTEIDDAEQEWVRLGLMSLLGRMLEDNGVTIVSDKSVLAALNEEQVPKMLDQRFLDRISQLTGAGLVLGTNLQHQGGLYRLSVVLTGQDGAPTRRVVVGESPAAVAADMAKVVGRIVAGDESSAVTRLARVSADPFINEVYARALDLELQGKLEEARTLFRVASEQEPDLFWLRYEIALCTRDLREWDEAVAMLDALIAESRSANDERALIATLNSTGVLHLQRRDYEAAEEPLKAALAIADTNRFPSTRASAHVNLALVASNRGDKTSAREHYEQALMAYDEAEVSLPPIFANNFAGLLIAERDLGRAQEFSEKAVEGFRLRGQRRYEAIALNRLAELLRERGDLDGAFTRHEQALAIHRELGNAVGETTVIIAMADAYREKGDLTRAKLNALEVNERANSLDDKLLVAASHMTLAQVESDFGNHATALKEYEAARSIYVAIARQPSILDADAGIAGEAIALSDLERARDIAMSMLDSAQAMNDDGVEARARLILGRIQHASGDPQSAIDHFLAVLENAHNRGDDLLEIEASQDLADLYLDQDQPERAAELITNIENQGSAGRTLLRLNARLAHANGDTDRAIDLMIELRAIAGEAWSVSDDALLASFNANPDSS